MTSWPDARALAHAAGTPLPSEAVPLDVAAGRVLTTPLVARCALPPFDAAAMDGWAVRGPGPWRVVGRVLAGDPPPPVHLEEGEAVEVATGAVVPRGCEGVLPYEDGSPSGRLVGGAHPGGRHVRAAGEECAEGETVLGAGARLSAAAVGLAAAVGHDTLLVRRKPRVTLLVTGAELLTSGLPAAGRIRDALGPLLLPALAGLGAQVLAVHHLPDDRTRLREALTGDADLLLTTGASSAGPVDHLSGVLAELGAAVLVDGVAVKPGHPQLLARLPDGPLVVGLPGNPLAALVGFLTLVTPLLQGMAGLALPAPTCVVAGETLEAHPASYRLVAVAVRDGRAFPVGRGGPAMLRGAAAAEALAVVPSGRPLQAGEQVEVLPLP